MFGCAGSSSLLGLFSSCGKWDLLSSWGLWASCCGGFSCFGAQAVNTLSSCCFWAQEHRLSSCGAWAWLLQVMSGLPGSGIKPMSPVWGFFTTEPARKPRNKLFIDCYTNTLKLTNLSELYCLWMLFFQCHGCFPVYCSLGSCAFLPVPLNALPGASSLPSTVQPFQALLRGSLLCCLSSVPLPWTLSGAWITVVCTVVTRVHVPSS